jgi:23S rRNA (uracil1939-C5)-methyltransferase
LPIFDLTPQRIPSLYVSNRELRGFHNLPYNRDLEIIIEKMIYGGDGLARLPADEHGRGKAVFVPFVLPGEHLDVTLIEQKPGFARGRLDKLLEPSPQRIEPQCPYFQRCGGCHYQHTGYEHQLAIKAEILKENLRRLAKLELENELKVHASPPWGYRNRSRFRVRSEGTFAAGYFKFNSHELLAVEQCPISSPLINRALAKLWELGRAGEVSAELREIEFFADADDAKLLVELYVAIDQRGPRKNAEAAARAAQDFAERLTACLPEIVSTCVYAQTTLSAPGAVTPMNEEPLWVSNPERLRYRARAANYRVSAGSFFQVNRHMVDELADVVAGGQEGKLGLDLYAGVGLFSTVLAPGFGHIIAVESSQSSFADLRYNAAANVKAVRAGVEEYLAKGNKERSDPDFIVVDPPRSGLGERVVQGLLKLAAPRLTYVSCDPATLARDLRSLLAGGYKVQQAHLLDLFPQTFHIESVLQLTR